jgi:hypothetical protein
MRGYFKRLIREVLSEIEAKEKLQAEDKAIMEPPNEVKIKHTVEQYKSTVNSTGEYTVLYCERMVTNSLKTKPHIQKFLFAYTPGFNEVFELLGKPLFPMWAETSVKNPFFFTEMGEITELFNVKKYKDAEVAVVDNFGTVM